MSAQQPAYKGSTGGTGRAPQVLVVDDEALFAKSVCRRLQGAGCECVTADTVRAARETLRQRHCDLVLLDMRLPDGSGMDLLAELREKLLLDTPVVVLTAYGEIDDAVQAIKLGAADYLKKPIDLEELMVMVQQTLERMDLTRRLQYSRARESRTVEGVEMVGESPAVRALCGQIERIVDLAGHVAQDAPPPTVLILGETGTGKDLAARLLHLKSARRERPFVHVDCGTLPKELIEAELFGHERGAFTNAISARPGLIEAAEDGTVFLDEVGELPLDLQSKLLALLGRRAVRRIGSTEDRPVGAWIIAATNRDPRAMMQKETFRPDLYYRLNELELTIPPLRERGEDVVELAHYFAERTARRYGLKSPQFEEDALEVLRAYHWPGNVRELRHLVERAVLFSEGHLVTGGMLGIEAGVLARGDEKPGSEGADLEGLTLDEAERLLIARALTRSGGNISEAARRLGVTRMALRYRMQKHGLSREEVRSGAH
ncbi:MAG: sigma-54-dependent Fis family transcriptional regulator [Gammaproteobacteria bacterium]|nr:sigma-54-dependent Fis family transcriptional regulator [Gammaproteobacteria bacterium]NIR59533.1 sigma-54-dependent Fis family transcriptional regulator [Gammaproteobacteria bacterium]